MAFLFQDLQFICVIVKYHLNLFSFNEKEIFYEIQLAHISGFARPVVTPLGNGQVFHWSRQTSSWELVFSIPAAECDNYASYGANSICSVINPLAPICGCLKGFVPFSFFFVLPDL